MTAFPTTAVRRAVFLCACALLIPLSVEAQRVAQAPGSGRPESFSRPGAERTGPGPGSEGTPLGVPVESPLVVEELPEPVVKVVLAEMAEARPSEPTFLDRQLAYPRVRRAYERKAERVEATLDSRGIEDVREVFFRVFKREQELEVWVREPGTEAFERVNVYPVCAVSGELGPKRQQGDQQVPEGFYEIDVFNPSSRYHLSMRVDYPNPVDRVRGHRTQPGGDIYIHGGCATIGCVPVTDEFIEELYLIAADARSAGQRRIPVHIFPTRLDGAGLAWLEETYGAGHVDFPFWQNLREGYRLFEETRTLPGVGYDGGRYTFTRPSRPLGEPVESLTPVPAPAGTASS